MEPISAVTTSSRSRDCRVVLAIWTWSATSASTADTKVATELNRRCIYGSVEEITKLLLRTLENHCPAAPGLPGLSSRRAAVAGLLAESFADPGDGNALGAACLAIRQAPRCMKMREKVTSMFVSAQGMSVRQNVGVGRDMTTNQVTND